MQRPGAWRVGRTRKTMGIDAHALHCLDYAKLFGDFGRTATLGRQNLYIKPAVLEARYGSRLDWKKQV
jgi:hypothetical protein